MNCRGRKSPETNELEWKPGERHMFADFVSPFGIWGRDPTYPSAYADDSSYAALRATYFI
jgi:hypothetical protein